MGPAARTHLTLKADAGASGWPSCPGVRLAALSRLVRSGPGPTSGSPNPGDVGLAGLDQPHFPSRCWGGEVPARTVVVPDQEGMHQGIASACTTQACCFGCACILKCGRNETTHENTMCTINLWDYSVFVGLIPLRTKADYSYIEQHL